MTERIEIKVPDIGDFQDVEVIEVMVAKGDRVEVEDGLVTVETDKAAMDIPATVAGTVTEISLKVGDKVSEGDLCWCWRRPSGNSKRLTRAQQIQKP